MKPTAELGTASDTPTSIAAQIERLRAERAELERVREERAAASEQLAELEREQQALADERVISAMVEEHGPLGKAIDVVQTDRGVIVVRRPTAMKFRRFQDKGSFGSDDVLEFARPCVLHPTRAEFDSILDELPATLARVANVLVTLAGQRTEELAKK